MMFVAVLNLQPRTASALSHIRHDSVPLTPAGFSGPFHANDGEFVLLADTFGPQAYVPVLVGVHGEQRFLTRDLSIRLCDSLRSTRTP
jgi:hypothetical protein